MLIRQTWSLELRSGWLCMDCFSKCCILW